MFVSRADVLLEQLGKSEPELLAGLTELAAAWDTPRRGAVVDKVWPRLKKIAIDYTVAEPAAAAGRLAVVPGDFDWDDVGDFAAIAKLNSGGRKANLAILGENARVLADASSGIVVSQSGRLISLVGVTDIVVVDTPDALLVTTTANAQRVKAVVDALKLSGRGRHPLTCPVPVSGPCPLGRASRAPSRCIEPFSGASSSCPSPKSARITHKCCAESTAHSTNL